ncbi:MAG: hypothetical protein CRU78_06945 [Candidatus Accumulibacter phosphatis]|uniref:Uncharacterized protein n=1 Tax=Candidatus Accumulibacter phosphatis TaxID=327160 RepID=A0A6A7RRU6_9PROT|nr:hypothetical protein [Candidatus Accumulibacter phosphatis]
MQSSRLLGTRTGQWPARGSAGKVSGLRPFAVKRMSIAGDAGRATSTPLWFENFHREIMTKER